MRGVVTIGQHGLTVDAHAVGHTLFLAPRRRIVSVAVAVFVSIVLVGNAVAILVGRNDERVSGNVLVTADKNGMENIAVLRIPWDLELLAFLEIRSGGDVAGLEDLAVSVTPLDLARQRRQRAGHLQLSHIARSRRVRRGVEVGDVERDITVVHHGEVDVVVALERTVDQASIIGGRSRARCDVQTRWPGSCDVSV